jgi:hypothetical protein
VTPVTSATKPSSVVEDDDGEDLPLDRIPTREEATEAVADLRRAVAQRRVPLAVANKIAIVAWRLRALKLAMEGQTP